MRWVIGLLLLLCSLAAEATEVLRGRVTDTEGRPMPGVTIRVRPLRESKVVVAMVTNKEGRYSFSLAPGDYRVTAGLMGYREETRSVSLPMRETVDFVLKEDPKLLGEVVVLAPSHERALQHQALSAMSLDVSSVISSLSSLSDLVGQSSGVNVRGQGGLGSGVELSINGLGGQAVRYFIDGVPLSSRGSGLSLETLPANIVDRIEIYKGVVPPELGMDALGGAVNIITKKSRTNFLDASLRLGSFGTIGADLHGQYRHAASGLTLRPTLSCLSSRNNYTMKGVSVWDEEAYDFVRRDLPRFHDGYRTLTAGVQLGVTQVRWADEALLGVQYTGSDKEIQTGFMQTLVIGEATRRRSDLSLTGRYAKKDLLTPGLSAQVDAAVARDHMLLADTTYRKYSWDGTSVETNYSEVTRRGKALRHTLRPGLSARVNLSYDLRKWGKLNFNYQLSAVENHRYDDYDTSFDETKDRMARHILGLSYGGYLLDGRLHALTFVKDYLYTVSIGQSDLEWLTGSTDVPSHFTKNNIGYGLGLRYAPLEALSVKGSFEYATQLPSARELMGNGITIYPNFKLRPERAYNLNLVLYGQTSPAQSHFLNYEATLFYRDVHDFIHRVVHSDVESQYENIGTSRIVGLEGELRYTYDSLLDITLNGTYTDERDRTRQDRFGKTNATYGYRIPNRPWLYGNLITGLTMREPFGLNMSKIRLNLSLGYIKWFYLTWAAFGSRESKAIIPSQYNLSGGVTWSFRHNRYSISLQGDNLLDRPLYDNYMLQKPGRSVYCKLRLFLN